MFSRFVAKNGKEVVLRTPRWEDLDDLHELSDSLVNERAEFLQNEKMARREEIDWLRHRLGELEKNEVFCLIAGVDNKVIAISKLSPRKGYASHVGDIDAEVKNGYRDIGIGTELLKSLVSQARTLGLVLLALSVYSTNKRAIHVYETMGFKEVGRIPRGFFKEGKYIDEIIMIKELDRSIARQGYFS